MGVKKKVCLKKSVKKWEIVLLLRLRPDEYIFVQIFSALFHCPMNDTPQHLVSPFGEFQAQNCSMCCPEEEE